MKSVRNEKRCSIIVLTRLPNFCLLCLFGSEWGELLGNSVYAMHGIEAVNTSTVSKGKSGKGTMEGFLLDGLLGLI